MSLFGGYSVYYLGIYGFGSSFTKDPDDRWRIVLLFFSQMYCTVMLCGNFRAHVLARFDGMESFATIIGTALSPVVFNATDYYGCYAIRWENILASKIRNYPFLLKKIAVEGPTSLNSFSPGRRAQYAQFCTCFSSGSLTCQSRK